MEMLSAIGFLLGLATILAVVLAIANAKLKVFEDPRIDRVAGMLPGSNCGACGFPGCRAFAEKTVSGDVQPGGCSVGGPDTARLIADYLGVDPGKTEKTVARLLCAGGTDVAVQMAAYTGYPSCRAAAVVAGGGKGCRYGCLGFGDCQVVCTFDAITMSPTGLPIVDADRCTSCGDCVGICPKGLLEIMPLRQKLLVQCRAELEGEAALAWCRAACTGCGRCVADAAQGLLKMKKTLPEINRNLLHLQSPAATLRCPTRAIVWVEGQQAPHIMEEDVPAGRPGLSTSHVIQQNKTPD